MPVHNSGMDATTARTLNIRRWVADAGGPAEWSRRYSPTKEDGSPRWPQPQVSQWISESDPKPIGSRLARDLETAMGLQRGVMDRPPESQLLKPDLDTIHRALDFLEEMFEAHGKEWDRKRYPLLLAAVVEDLLAPDPPSVVQLTVKYGGVIDAGRDWGKDQAAGAG